MDHSTDGTTRARREVTAAVREKFEKAKASGGSPVLYVNKHGQVGVMNVARIGKSRTPRAAPQVTNAILRARIRSLEMELAAAQDRITALLAENEMLGQGLTSDFPK